MVQLESLSGATAGSLWSARRFPFRVGRSPGSDLVLDEAGVWDQHCVIELQPGEGFQLRATGEALVRVNAEPAAEVLLRNGDRIDLGAAQLRFWLAPATQRSLRIREACLWTLLLAVAALQVLVIYRLLD